MEGTGEGDSSRRRRARNPPVVLTCGTLDPLVTLGHAGAMIRGFELTRMDEVDIGFSWEDSLVSWVRAGAVTARPGVGTAVRFRVARAILSASRRRKRHVYLTFEASLLRLAHACLPRLTDWGLARWMRKQLDRS